MPVVLSIVHISTRHLRELKPFFYSHMSSTKCSCSWSISTNVHAGLLASIACSNTLQTDTPYQTPTPRLAPSTFRSCQRLQSLNDVATYSTNYEPRRRLTFISMCLGPMGKLDGYAKFLFMVLVICDQNIFSGLPLSPSTSRRSQYGVCRTMISG
jgi:hypothetical protein